MNTIQQTHKNSCLACVLAMMVGESEEYVLDWFEYKDPPFSDHDAFIFLAHHGMYLCLNADLAEGAEKGIELSPIHEINIHLNLSTHKCYMVVDSEITEKMSHAVFWDGKYVYDPLYSKPQNIKNYTVRRIYPMGTTTERGVK